MENAAMQDKDRDLVRKELLKHLKRLEEEDWIVFGWNHMNLNELKWLREPQNLADCDYYQKVFKNWLSEKRLERIVAPKKHNPNGLVQYKGAAPGMFDVETINFQMWLAKGVEVCALSYGEHEFKNDVSEKMLGQTGFNIVFYKNWLDVIPKILNKKRESN